MYLIDMKSLLGLIIFIIGCKTPEKKVIIIPIKIFDETDSSLCRDLSWNLNISEKELEKISDIKAESSLNQTFTHCAASSDYLKQVLDKGAALDKPDHFENTPLILAVKSNHYKNVELLLSKGSNVNHIDGVLNPPYIYALKNRDKEMLKILMKYNFNPNVKGLMDYDWQYFNFEIENLTVYVKKYNSENKTKEEIKTKKKNLFF